MASVGGRTPPGQNKLIYFAGFHPAASAPQCSRPEALRRSAVSFPPHSFVALLVMLHSTQELEAPDNLERFRLRRDIAG